MRSFLSGGAGALAGLSGSGMAGLTLRQTLIVTGSSFVVTGLYRLGEFLTLHGAPERLQQSLETAANAAAKVEAAASVATSAIAEAKEAAATVVASTPAQAPAPAPTTEKP